LIKCKTETLYRIPIHTEIKTNSLVNKCPMCKTVKSYDDFHKNKAGLVSRCNNYESYRKSGTIKVGLEKKRPDNVRDGCKWCPKCEVEKSREEFYSVKMCYSRCVEIVIILRRRGIR
jgi:hypothetical protein